NQIAERISPQYGALQSSIRILGARNRKLLIVTEFVSHAGSLPSFGEPRGDGGKDISSMKSFAYRMQVVVFDIRVAHDETFFFAFVNDGEHAVVGRHKILILGADQQRPALGSHPRIHDHNVDRLRRKVGIGGANRQRSVEQIKRRDVVRDVHDSYIG